jgi:hypothetical protein
MGEAMSAYVEQNCTIEHEGRQFTSGGAVVSESYLVAYPDEGGVLKDWHGNIIGTYTVLGSRPAIFFGHRSWQGSTYYYMRGHVGKAYYSLRGFGHGMIAKGKRTK